MLEEIFENNKQWASRVKASDPEFFVNLSGQQKPEYLWIGCADSRVPATEITNMMPGEIFVHRNIANLVVHTDLNCLSVLQYAVEVLRVKHIIVCGHYGCGGVMAAMGDQPLGLIDNWLRNIRDSYRKHQDRIDALEDEKARVDLLCELNVIEQVANICHTSIVQGAWKAGQELSVHGLIYNIEDGILKDLDASVSSAEEVASTHRLK